MGKSWRVRRLRLFWQSLLIRRGKRGRHSDRPPGQRGEYKARELFQTAGLTNSYLNPEPGLHEPSVPEQNRVCSINSEYVHSELSVCVMTTKTYHQWTSDTMIHHGNRGEKKLPCFTPLELEILPIAFGKYEHIFRGGKQFSCNSKGEKVGVGDNCCPSQCITLNSVVCSFKI